MRRKWLTCLHRNRSKSKQMKHFLMYHISCQYITTFILPVTILLKEKKISMHESPLIIKQGNKKLFTALVLSTFERNFFDRHVKQQTHQHKHFGNVYTKNRLTDQ